MSECEQPQECDHQWTDYATLKSGDNPKLEIEACVRCGVQQKKQATNLTVNKKEGDNKCEN